MEKKYQVFISSTYEDLKEERKKVQEILLMADCIPAGMEAFVATNDEQFNVIKKVIDLCDYYVLIIGGRYGSINDNTGISYTEMEYDYAVSKGIPVLAFIIDGSVKLSIGKTDNDSEKKRKLDAFILKAKTNRLVSFWKASSELEGLVAISIMRAKNEIERPGWIRANSVATYDNSELLAQINKLRIENDELKGKIKASEKKLAEIETFESTDIAFDEEPIVISSWNTYDQQVKTTSLREMFGVISLQMLTGSANMLSIERSVVEFVSGSEHYTLDDSTIVRKMLNQFLALGLIQTARSGFALTELGRKVKDEINLIRRKES